MDRSTHEALHHRLALLEDASAKAWSERDNMESRISTLEREHTAAIRASEHAFEGIACRVTELAISVAEFPQGPVLQGALEQLQWLEEEGSGQRMWLQDLVTGLESRVSYLEQCIHSVEESIAGIEVKATTGDHHARFAESLCARFCELKALSDTKAECKDVDRLGQALNQSCRDLTSTLKVHQQNLAQLEQQSSKLGYSVEQNSQDVIDFRDFLAKRDQELFDLERQWSKRLWGYGELSSSRRARPQSARGTKQTDGTSTPWKPWPSSSAKFETRPTVPQPTNFSDSDSLPCRLCGVSPTQGKSFGKTGETNKASQGDVVCRLCGLSPASKKYHESNTSHPLWATLPKTRS